MVLAVTYPWASASSYLSSQSVAEKERKKTDNPREGWEDGTPPPHRDFAEDCSNAHTLFSKTASNRDLFLLQNADVVSPLCTSGMRRV